MEVNKKKLNTVGNSAAEKRFHCPLVAGVGITDQPKE